VLLSSLFNLTIIPGHVELKLPAVRPYAKQKHSRGAIEVEKPHNRNTESVEPMVEMRMQVVTWQRSTRLPMAMQPKTDAMLNMMIVRAEMELLAPSCAA
jgi:hypothetical protein